MGKNKKRARSGRATRGKPAHGAKSRNRLWLIVGGVAALALVLVVIIPLISGRGGEGRDTTGELELYDEKTRLLEEYILSDNTERELGINPAGNAGNAVFISVCSGSERAEVYSAAAATLSEAWQTANEQARAAVESGVSPLWVKADVVYISEAVTDEELSDAIIASRQDFYRYGVAFDEDYELALLESELNANKIYEYEEGGVSLSYLNNYLRKTGRDELSALPESYRVFQCFGWLCDENSEVYALSAGGLDYGRRAVETIDREYTAGLVESASAFLVNQVKEDGAFIYGMYPRFDNEIDNYNIVRHASTIWSLICRYRMLPDVELSGVIDSTIEYMLGEVIYSDDNTAYLYEEKADEIKLGACGMAVVAMTEYMDAFDSDRYTDVCIELGNGILSMLNQETGEYYHVLGGDFSRKEEFRTVYYDGEATFALCRLYSLTGDKMWLDAAMSAVEHFIEADYTQYKDHWIAYSMNEITKHVSDPAYYTFALENVQKNVEEIYQRDTTYHTYLELLMASFEIYDRMIEQGIVVDYLEEFDLPGFLKTIYVRADRMLNGYFYPEYAMYMENPERILNTFMVRHDGYRVRIDDVQHNIGGYYLYYKNYEEMVGYGLLEYRD